MCYIIQSQITGRIYIGYTVDYYRRIRQHNGELVGGAKKTSKGRPWSPICVIGGFTDNHTALRFEYKMQHSGRRPKKNYISFYLNRLYQVLITGDGLLGSWPPLTIYWFQPLYDDKLISLPNLSHFNITG